MVNWKTSLLHQIQFQLEYDTDALARRKIEYSVNEIILINWGRVSYCCAFQEVSREKNYGVQSSFSNCFLYVRFEKLKCNL
jgi:hypothetical protein